MALTGNRSLMRAANLHEALHTCVCVSCVSRQTKYSSVRLNGTRINGRFAYMEDFSDSRLLFGKFALFA